MKMYIVYLFLNEVRFRAPYFKQWILDEAFTGGGTNLLTIDEEDGWIIITDSTPGIEFIATLRLSPQQLAQLLDNWETKVCPQLPQVVKITYRHNAYLFTTYDTLLPVLYYKLRWATEIWASQIERYYRKLIERNPYVILWYYEDQYYRHDWGRDDDVDIVSEFLCNMGFRVVLYREWILNGTSTTIGGREKPSLRKAKGSIMIASATPESYELPHVTMSLTQFAQLLDDWETKVCEERPRRVKLVHKKDEYVLTTTH